MIENNGGQTAPQFNAESFEKQKDEDILKFLDSPEEIRAWVHTYLDLYMPMGSIEDESNSSPIEAMWEVYQAVRRNTGNITPGYIWLSSRDSYKTLTASILEILLLIHFRTTIAHAAAILDQSAKAVEYCETFMLKVLPYLHTKGWKLNSSSKRRIEFLTDKKEKCYIQIIVLTDKGANSAHTQIMFVDEVDLCNPSAYEEAKMIPGVQRGKYPIVVRLSTRKYAFGLMEKAIQEAPGLDEKVLRWNVLDMTEYCPPERCKPELPKVVRYVPVQLPFMQMSEELFEKTVDDKDKDKYERVEAFEGCTKCKLLSVCKTKLHTKKTPDMTGDLWKPIDATIIAIAKVNPDVGEAQYRCNKPSTAGLVFPRFDSKEGGNVITLENAWIMVRGEVPPPDEKSDFDAFVAYLKSLGLPFYAGMDFGYTANHAMIVGAQLPTEEFLVIDCYSQPGLEPDDIVKICQEWQEKYGIDEWYPDPAYPAYIKMLRKFIRCGTFTKDTAASVGATKSAIVLSNGFRRLKILKTVNNQLVINGFGIYHWKLNPVTKVATDVLDDTGDEADIMDSARYLFQNIFGKVKKTLAFAIGTGKKKDENEGKTREQIVEDYNKKLIYAQLPQAREQQKPEVKDGKKRGIVWNF